MTAQVALLNGLGVALASDSAVSYGGKVLNSSEKIFELHLPHKVAVLTSGRADFMGIPWEVVLSAWSQTLDRPFVTIADYRESLFKFVRTILPDDGSLTDSEKAYLRSSYWGPTGVFEATRSVLSDAVLPFYQSILGSEDLSDFMADEEWDSEFRDKMTSLLTEEVIEEVRVRLEGFAQSRADLFEPVPGLKESLARVWVDKYWSEYSRSPYDDFSTWPRVPGLDEWVNDLWSHYIVNADYVGETGLHILGYGSEDLFPSGAGVFFHGVVNGVLLKRFEGVAPSISEPRAFFFGQSDAIRNITSGEDNLLINTAVQTSKRTLTDIYERIAEVEAEGIESTKEYIMQSLERESMADEMRRAGDEERGKPFNRAIEMAPILDLAEFAAQLVGVQAASAAMTQENPSVGGPVDVAVITHRSGFQWIRHAK